MIGTFCTIYIMSDIFYFIHLPNEEDGSPTKAGGLVLLSK